MEREDTQLHLTLGPFRFRKRGDFLTLVYLPRYDGQSAHVFDEPELRALHKMIGAILAELPEEKEGEG